MAMAALAFAVPNFNDGLLAILRPVRAWNGTLLPRIAFTNLPPFVLRGETVRLKLFREKKVIQVEMVVVERPLLPGDISPRRTVAPAGSGSPEGPPRPFPTSRRTF